jgi:DNA-binding NarL/FixJ family response regulator
MNLLLSHAGWEDEAWVDRLPRLLSPMGVVSHRANSGEQASRVIRSLEIHLAIVDLALPLTEPNSPREAERAPELAEGGTRLLELLARLPAPPPVVAVARHRTSRGDARDMSEALKWGAFAVVNRPQRGGDVEMVLDVIKRCVERHYRGRWPGRA